VDATPDPFGPGTRVALLGLGNMGTPMARRLLAAGVRVTGFDPSDASRQRLVDAGGSAEPSASAAVVGADVVVLMLPSSAVVESVLRDPEVLGGLRTDTIVIDMSSSEPTSTQVLASELAGDGITLIDAPVSGGVGGAEAGTLAIMAGGPAAVVDRVAWILAALGTVKRVGVVGSGHALKAINNLLSAVHLLATSEGIAAGRRFGLDPALMLDVLNTSSGRSGSTEVKFPKFVLPETYDSGFALRLMLKDMRVATGLAKQVGVTALLGERAVELCADAESALGPDADQTEIARWVWEEGAR
jgi:3-hydroxyisobutyrate dehydrogenase